MGDRANVLVRENSNDNGVYLYTHWSGSDLPATVQDALAKRWRWDDPSYLTRIIFDAMTEGYHGEETGFGISTFICDGQSRVLTVDCESRTVSRNGKVWSFEEYIVLNKETINTVIEW